MANAKVEILINGDTRQWDHGLIEGLFTPEEAELIKSIPLSRCAAEDTLFWPFTNNGVYTSKSGYRFLKAETQTEWFEDQMEHDKVLWRTIWSLQVPNKIKNLVWRAYKNSLPTKENLVRQTIVENPTCDRYKHEPESALHALWNCSELDVVWEEEPFQHCRRRQTFVDFKELLSWLITKDHNLELFATLVWLIWTQRNQVCFSQPNLSVHQISLSAKEHVAEFVVTQPARSITRPNLTLFRTNWRPPIPEVVKINCDEAIFKEQKKIGHWSSDLR